jgi:hypothetical protein
MREKCVAGKNILLCRFSQKKSCATTVVHLDIIFDELHCDGEGELYVSSAKLKEAPKSQVKGPKPRLEGVDPMQSWQRSQALCFQCWGFQAGL